MCMSSPSMPKPPAPIIIPQAPVMADIVAPVIKQAAPKTSDSVFKRRGKAGMVIQMGTQSSNIPGA
jgi:hypothetical protein